MKRILSYLVIMVIVFNLTGCAGNKVEGNVKVEDTGYNGQLPIVKDKITLTYANSGGLANTTAPPSNDLPTIQEYEKLTNVHIEWEVIPGAAYAEQMTARLNAGVDLPDIFVAPAAIRDDMGDTGVLLELSDLIKKNAPNMVKFQQDKFLEEIKGVSASGKKYAIGGYVLPDVIISGIMLNKFWLENLNLKVPKTTDEFYNMLVAFKDKDPNGNGKKDEIPLSTQNKDHIHYLKYSFGIHAGSSGGYNVDKNGKVVNDHMTSRYKDYLTYMNKLYTEGLLDKGYPSVNQNALLDKPKNDSVGAIIQWHSWAPRFSSLHPQGDKDGLTPIFIPIEPLAGPYGDKFTIRRVQGEGGVSIAKSCKYPEIAVRWLDFIIYGKQAHDLYVYGVEGITFKEENGKKVLIQPKEPDKTWEQVLISIGGRQPAHPYVQTVESRKTMFPEWIFPYDEINRKYYIDPFPGNFVKLSSAEEAEWDQYATEVNAYINDMDTKFITGQVPLSGFDEFVSTAKKMGMDKMLEINQKRYDRYLELKKQFGK